MAVRAEDVRASLRINVLPAMVQPKGHSHPFAAMQRTAATVAMEKAIFEAGLKPYHVSLSDRESDLGARGCRLYYWDKDVRVPVVQDPIRVDDVLVMTDVDYHLDMPSYMVYFRPIMLYTLSPTHASYRGPDYQYRINKDTVEYTVHGGGRYQHKIWNYDHDVVASRHGKYIHLFLVDQRDITVGGDGGGHRFITLIPYVRIPAFLADEIGYQLLERKSYVKNGVVSVYNPTSGDISVTVEGSYESVSLSSRLFEALAVRLASKEKKAFIVGDIEVFLHEHKFTDLKVMASLLYRVYSRSLDVSYKPNCIPTASVVKDYAPLDKLPLTPGESMCTAITNPLVTEPALFPMRNIDTAAVAVEHRVSRLHNSKVPPEWYTAAAIDFTNRLVPNPGVGHPVDFDEVEKKQSRPLQRVRYSNAKHRIGTSAKNRLQTFVKAEPMRHVSAPRVITTCAAELTAEMSRYVYAFKDCILTKQPWYGPCKEPLDAINRFRSFGANGYLIDDFNRFDGTISRWLQENVGRRAYLRWLAASERKMFKKYHVEVFKASARSDQGFVYYAGHGTRSGSPITTDYNTLENTYIHYCALRMIGFDDASAWENLGLYAGDDGLTAMFPGLVEAVQQVVKDLGLSVKVEATGPNDPISYLGRIFPAPLTHDDSHQDFMRTLTKLHLTANKSVTREQAAYNKAAGYLVTDSLTPILSDWCRQVQLLSKKTQVLHALREEEWKIDNCSWPQRDPELILSSICRLTGLKSEEVAERQKAIRDAKDLDSFPVVIISEREVKVAAVVGDVLLQPPADGAAAAEVVSTSAPPESPGPSIKPDIHQQPLCPTDTVIVHHPADADPAAHATTVGRLIAPKKRKPRRRGSQPLPTATATGARHSPPNSSPSSSQCQPAVPPPTPLSTQPSPASSSGSPAASPSPSSVSTAAPTTTRRPPLPRSGPPRRPSRPRQPNPTTTPTPRPPRRPKPPAA